MSYCSGEVIMHFKNNEVEGGSMLLTPKETSQILRVKVNTLAKWRCHNSHPELEPVKIGSRCFYKYASVLSFIKQNTANDDQQGGNSEKL